MSRKQTAYIIALTALYLCFELAFNARLLDVVGGSATLEQIHHIEVFGRSLTGCAVGLIVLQVLLSFRARNGGVSPRGMTILFLVSLSGVSTYFALSVLVEQLVASSDASFRRTSLNVVLIQQALVDNKVALDGLTDDAGLYRQAAGKAFLAQFPLMAMAINRLDEKIRDAKLALLSHHISKRVGHADGYYHDAYLEAVRKTHESWQRYSRAPTSSDLEGKISAQQDKAWSDYINDLGRRGWTPSTVPPIAHDAVLKKVRSRVPVPSTWRLDDEGAFREAVAAKAHQRINAASSSQKLVIHGQKIPPGMSWSTFFSHAGVQAELREKLYLPPGLVLLPTYASAAAFQREVFDPMVKNLAHDELTRYDAPISDFADDGKLERHGLDAARLAIVPPLALFFSLLGALTHLGKLFYLALKSFFAWQPAVGERFPHVWPVIAVVVAGFWLYFSFTDNAVTQSRLYTYLRQQIYDSAGEEIIPLVKARMLTNAMHVVAVGQDFGYPYFEGIRTHLLGGFSFGYKNHAH